MSDTWGESWSNNTNAPDIPPPLYHTEKAYFSQSFLVAISYGAIIVLFFKCMSALVNPVKAMSRVVKWALIAHTAAMFSLLTIPVAIGLATLSDEYINNRDFPGSDSLPPGPYSSPQQNALVIVFSLGFPLNQWLADGLLLYRCHIVYSKNFKATALPCLIYVATIGLGLTYIYEAAVQYSSSGVIGEKIDTSYYSACLALNLVLMSMIITRLALHSRDMRRALGPSAPSGGLYQTISTILIESFFLYAVSLVLFIGTWASGSIGFFPVSAILGPAQVAAPFLVILRVAKQRAMTSEELSSAKIESIRFKSHQGSSGCEETETIRDEVRTERTNRDVESLGENSRLGLEDNHVVEEPVSL